MDVAHDDSAAKSDSLFHKAASFAIYAIIASFVLQFVYAQIWLRIPPDVARLVSYVPTVAIIPAIPAGFIALCGIPRYGRRKLLWKGLVGVIFPIVLVVSVVYYNAYLRARIIVETQKMEQKK